MPLRKRYLFQYNADARRWELETDGVVVGKYESKAAGLLGAPPIVRAGGWTELVIKSELGAIENTYRYGEEPIPLADPTLPEPPSAALDTPA